MICNKYLTLKSGAKQNHAEELRVVDIYNELVVKNDELKKQNKVKASLTEILELQQHIKKSKLCWTTVVVCTTTASATITTTATMPSVLIRSKEC